MYVCKNMLRHDGGVIDTDRPFSWFPLYLLS
jgi:hypothetical protein